MIKIDTQDLQSDVRDTVWRKDAGFVIDTAWSEAFNSIRGAVEDSTGRVKFAINYKVKISTSHTI